MYNAPIRLWSTVVSQLQIPLGEVVLEA